MTFLKAVNVRKEGPGDFRLDRLNFAQRKGEKIAIAGETGAGKSTLLKLVAGLMQPDKGELLFEKKKISGPEDQLVPGHPGIAYLSQHFELQKFLRVEQVLDYSNTLSESEATKLYEVCQIDHLLKRRTDELSGGEKQRVAICRLLISSPRLLLLDEPFSHLDMMHKNTLKRVIHDIGEKLRITCVIVSHDPLDTLSWAERIFVMKEGRIIQTGSPEEIYREPADEYVGGLFGKYNLIEKDHYKGFSKLKGFKKIFRKLEEGKKIFIRPEEFALVKKEDRSVRGKVQGTVFFGSYEEAEVAVAGTVVIIRNTGKPLREGQTVHLALQRKHPWVV